MNVVDYVTVYYEVLRGQTVPGEVDGKFIVLANDAERFAVLAPSAMCVFHAQIVARFLSLNGVHGSLNTKGDRFAFHDSSWSIEGGGHWERDDDGLLRIFGESEVYGGIELEVLAGELDADHALGAERVRLG